MSVIVNSIGPKTRPGVSFEGVAKSFSFPQGVRRYYSAKDKDGQMAIGDVGSFIEIDRAR